MKGLSVSVVIPDKTNSIQHRSVISDIFDGKLSSSVQCLTCERVSLWPVLLHMSPDSIWAAMLENLP